MTDPNPQPTLGMVPSLRMLAPQIVVAGVLPVVGYILLRPYVGSDAVALAAVMVFPIGEIAFARTIRGRFDPIGVIALIGIGVGLVGAVAMRGDATLLKVRESLVTGVFGVACLASLAFGRPVMYYLGRTFATGGDPVKAAEFDTIWELPGVPTRFRFVTIVWGLTLVAEAVVRTILALNISTGVFLGVSGVVTWCVYGALIWFSVAYQRASERYYLEGADSDSPS